MTRHMKNLVLIAAVVAVLAVWVPTARAQKSICGEQDISALFAVADQTFDLSEQDAVLLSDIQESHWLPNGCLVRHIHRIIWINTNVGIRRYGDHRIPYDNAHCTLKVTTVRTWRDDQWWETGSTGIVTTLPHALSHGYDYTDLRETMLLHNGIEKPCILEIAYSIEDREPFRRGADGLWTFARDEPAVQSRFTLGLPTGQPLHVSVSDGVPDPVMETDRGLGLDVYSWTMGLVDAIPRPHTDDPAALVPHLVWSTWNSWEDYGDYLSQTMTSAMTIDDSLRTCLDSVVEGARTDGEKADLIADFVNDRTSFIRYPERYWLSSPREAARTYATAYGHRLDRAVLAAALFREAGLRADPVFLGRGYGDVDEGVPSLARMAAISVTVSGENLEAYYDPSSSSVSNGVSRAYGRTAWFPGRGDRPTVNPGGENELSVFDLRLSLSLDKKEKKFTGTGYYSADSRLCGYESMVGLAGEAKTFLNSVVTGLLDGVKVVDYTPSRFDRLGVVIGLELEMEKPEPDDQDRLRLVLAEPSGGIFDLLPHDVHLYDQERASPVRMASLMKQTIELSLDLSGLDVVYCPSSQTMENDAGRFSVTVDKVEDHITITREIELTQTLYQPEEWPELRALLLADSHERNRTLLVKTTADNIENGEDGGNGEEASDQ